MAIDQIEYIELLETLIDTDSKSILYERPL